MNKIKQLGGKAALILGSLCILHFLDFSSIQTQQVVDYSPPPLAGFSRFIQEIAQQRNDHYLTLDSCDESESFYGISTVKTDVTTPETPDKVKSVENSPDKWWFLHERPSPLRVCRELRSRPYFERLGLISTVPHLLSLRFIVSSHCERLHLHPKLRNMSQRRVTVLRIDGAERDAVNPARRERSTARSRKLRPPKELRLRTWLTGVLRYAVKTLLESADPVQKYRKIPKISPSKYRPPKLVTQKTLR